MIYRSLDIECDRLKLVIKGHFLPFYPPPFPLKNLKNQSLEKWKKIAGYIIILHICTKTQNHITVSEIQSETDKKFCHFGPFFALFTPLLTLKIKIWKKKMHGNIILLHMCTMNQDHMMYGSWDIRYNGQNVFVILGHFLPFSPH